MVCSELKMKGSHVSIITLVVCFMFAACGGGEDYESTDEAGCPDPRMIPGTPIIEDRCSSDSAENTPQI